MKKLYLLLALSLWGCRTPRTLVGSQETSRSIPDTVVLSVDPRFSSEPEEVRDHVARMQRPIDPPPPVSEERPVANEGRVPASTRVVETLRVKEQPVISLGMLAYDIPDTMRRGKTYLIRVRIAREAAPLLTVDLTSPRQAQIRTTSSMQVELVDPSPAGSKMFEISGNNSGVQMVEDSDHTEWSFNVSPLRAGASQLHLVVSIIQGDLRKQIVYRDAVLVQTDVQVVVKDFWSTHWQWLFTTLLLPLFLWWWKNRKSAQQN